MTAKIELFNIDDLIGQYNRGLSLEEVAKNNGIGSTTLSRRFKERGVNVFRKTKNPVDSNSVCQMFISGKSVNHISKQFNISRKAVTTILKNNGIKTRNRKEASILFTNSLTQEEINRKLVNAHTAAKGRIVKEESLIKKALTKEFIGKFDSVYEESFSNILTSMDIKTIPQKAVGVYNIDLATDTKIAVEMFGGNWHSTGSAAARFLKRCKHLFDQGWSLVIIWCDKSSESIDIACAEHIKTLHNTICTNPSLIGKYWMFRCDGQLQATGSLNDDHIPLIWSARSSFSN